MTDPVVGLIAIVVTLTIFCLGIAFSAGVQTARINENEKRIDRLENLITEGLDKLERLIRSGGT